MNLYDPVPDCVTVGRRRFRLCLTFDRVLRAFEIYADDSLFPEDKAAIALRLFVCGRVPKRYRREVLDQVFALIEPGKKSDSTEKSFDFSQDAGAIFASFMAEYGMDLYAERGKLHWHKFIALFQGLPESAHIMRVIDIRTRPIPAPNKHNQQEIKSLMQLKEQYRLKVDEKQRQEQLQSGLAKLFDALKSAAMRE